MLKQVDLDYINSFSKDTMMEVLGIQSIGSMGSTLLLDIEKEVPVGIEINANHVGGMSSGLVKAVGKIVHAGKRTHVWQVDLTDNDTGALVCTGRLTVMVVPRNK